MSANVRDFLKDRFNDAVRMDHTFFNPVTIDDLITCFGVHSQESLFPFLRQYVYVRIGCILNTIDFTVKLRFEPADFFMAMRSQQNKLYAHEKYVTVTRSSVS